MLAKFFKDAGILLVANLLSRASGLVMFPFYAQNLEVSDYGLFDYLYLIGVIGIIVVGLETHQGVLRLISTKDTHEERRDLFSAAFTYMAAVGLSALLIVTLVARVSNGSAFGVETAPEVLLVACAGWFVSALLSLLTSLQRALLEVRTIFYCSVITIVFQVATGIATVIILKLGVMGLFLASLIGPFTGLCYIFWKSRAYIEFRPHFSALREVLMFSTPLVISSIGAVGWIYADRYITKVALGLEELGILGVGYRFASLVALLTSALGMSLSPLIYTKFKEEGAARDISRLFRYFVATGAVIVACLAAYSHLVFPFIAPGTYQDAAVLFSLIAAALLMSSAYQFFPGLAIACKTTAIMLIQVSGLGFNVCLSVLLVRSHGVVGVTVASIVTATLVFLVTAAAGHRYYPIPVKPGPIGAVVIVLSGIIAALVSRRSDSVLVEWLGYSLPVIIVFIIVATGLIGRSELVLVGRDIRNRFAASRSRRKAEKLKS